MSDGRETAIRFENVSKIYTRGEVGTAELRKDLRRWYRRKVSSVSVPESDPASFYALKDISLSVNRGEKLGVIGRNGAGKSTMLKLISRITAPSEGTIRLRGKTTSLLEVGVGFHGDLTGRENIFMNGAVMGMKRSEIRAKMQDIIEFSEVGEFIDTPVKRYSSGMYVKLGFAVAAHLESDIVLMDEVLAVGDVHFRQKCLQKMDELARQEGRTVLYVSHNMSTVRALCDRCILLAEGKLVYEGDTEEAVTQYLYRNDDRQPGLSYTYGEASRPYVITPEQAHDFRLDGLQVLDVSQPVYTTQEHPEIRISCTSEVPRKNAGFRLELWYQDGTKIGSVMTGEPISLSAGANTVDLRLDLRHLIEGQYRADLIAYQVTETGEEYVLDRVYPGLLFTVSSAEGQNPFTFWNSRYWGYVQLNDMQVIGR